MTEEVKLKAINKVLSGEFSPNNQRLLYILHPIGIGTLDLKTGIRKEIKISYHYYFVSPLGSSKAVIGGVKSFHIIDLDNSNSIKLGIDSNYLAGNTINYPYFAFLTKKKDDNIYSIEIWDLKKEKFITSYVISVTLIPYDRISLRFGGDFLFLIIQSREIISTPTLQVFTFHKSLKLIKERKIPYIGDFGFIEKNQLALVSGRNDDILVWDFKKKDFIYKVEVNGLGPYKQSVIVVGKRIILFGRTSFGGGVYTFKEIDLTVDTGHYVTLKANLSFINADVIAKLKNNQVLLKSEGVGYKADFEGNKVNIKESFDLNEVFDASVLPAVSFNISKCILRRRLGNYLPRDLIDYCFFFFKSQ